jgi:hypothetical protein
MGLYLSMFNAPHYDLIKFLTQSSLAEEEKNEGKIKNSSQKEGG